MSRIGSIHPSQIVEDSQSTITTATAPSAPPPLLPSPPDLSGGDPITMLAKLMVSSAQQSQKGDELTEKTEADAEDAADARRVDEMKQKAEDNFTAGMIGGVSQIASGTCSIIGGAAGAAALDKAGPAGPTDAMAKNAGNIATIWEGAGQVGGGFGKIGETAYKNAADNADQRGAVAESDAKQAKRAQDELRRQIDAASQHEGKVTQLLQDIKQAQDQCMKAAILRM
jgi:hypothetical protein